MAISFGKHNIAAKEEGEQVIAFKRFIVPDGYDPITLENDIALVELVDDVVFTDHVLPACLPEGDVAEETLCFATGWGSQG